MNRRDVLAVRFDDVFSGVWSANHEAAILRLNENVVRPRTLYVVDHLPHWAALAATKTGMTAGRDYRWRG